MTFKLSSIQRYLRYILHLLHSNYFNTYIVIYHCLYLGKDESSPVMYKMCGMSQTTVFTGKSSYMHLEFKTNDNIEKNGFYLAYKAITGEICLMF